jgi:hypothetical protein
LWSQDQKSVYINSIDLNTSDPAIWQENVEGSSPEKLASGCGDAFAVSPDGRYLLDIIVGGEKVGIYEFSLTDRKCTELLPGVLTFGLQFDRNGKSFTYAMPSYRDVTFYRQNWQDGKVIGQPQVALKLPFAFPLISGGNAYDFASDLSTVVYARPGGHEDLYFLSYR